MYDVLKTGSVKSTANSVARPVSTRINRSLITHGYVPGPKPVRNRSRTGPESVQNRSGTGLPPRKSDAKSREYSTDNNDCTTVDFPDRTANVIARYCNAYLYRYTYRLKGQRDDRRLIFLYNKKDVRWHLIFRLL